MDKYLCATPIFDCDSEIIRKTAMQVTENCANPHKKAVELFYFVRDSITYNLYVKKHMPEHFKASNTLLRGKGYCVQKAVLLVTLARAVNIPAQLGCAQIRNHLVPQKVLDILRSNIFPWHGYANLYLNERWTKATPAFDIRMCNDHGFIPVEFDGYSDAMFPSHNKAGKPHIEYLLDRGLFEDVPLDQIRQALIERNMLDPEELSRDMA